MVNEQREANLKRWSELAPGECTVRAHSVEVGILSSTVGTSSGFHMNPELTFCDRALLTAALIEAIRARGWHYQLESQENLSGRYEQATIYRDPGQYVLADGDDARALESCDALLSAYVQALESTNRRRSDDV